ncbi:glutamine-rich protein 2 isoform X1 [Thunnus albacares]|uniref:glutamine-rich protein 2 isoform X1 n=1 Tax=Thunnus albacares TaxID=8236 RepID=UPI001CF6DDE2|nr:glutamine-rich protein 2 isoform X1 [Thunnus albacares]
MSEEGISLYELLNLSIGTPQTGAVNFSALHELLHAVLKQLGLREMKIRWKELPPGLGGRGHPEPLMEVSGTEQDSDTEEKLHRTQRGMSAAEREAQPGTELLERTPSSGTAADGQRRLQTRIQSCEDGVSKAMKLIQELHNQRDDMKEEMKELRHQQEKIVCAQAETDSAVEKCCQRLNMLEDTVISMSDAFEKYPDVEELSQCVTWDVMQSALLSERENLQKELVNSGVVDPSAAVKPFSSSSTAVNAEPSHTGAPSSPRAAEDAVSPAAPPVPAEQQTHPKTAGTGAGTPLTRKGSGSQRYPETVEALRNIGKLKEKHNKLEARVAELEEGKLDQTQLTQLRELVTNKGSRNVYNNLMDQMNQQRALIDSLMSDREKLDNLEDMFMNLSSQDRETSSEAASESLDSDSKASHELKPQISYLRKSVQKLEEDVKQLKAKRASSDQRATDRHLQDQLDDLRGMLEDMTLFLTSELSSSLEDEAVQDESDSEGKERSAVTSRTVNVGRKLSRLFQDYEQLQDTVNSILQLHTAGTAGPLQDTENVELVNDVQKSILQLQAECEKLHETTRCLHEDNRQKQSHIEELYKTTEELEEKKADKQMVETEIKADKSALDSKVSRLQFDSVTEQINTMFHELLNKVTGQEQDWHKVIDKLSTEMECKLNRIELDSVKKQLENRWKNIHEKLQAQGAPEHEDAAGIRKQLVDRFHCLSCDRPVVKHTPGPHLVTLPSTPGFPSHKSIRPFTVYALEQFRQHYRSLKPGTNRYNYEVANSPGRREQLQRSHAAMCRQIESAQRRLRHCDRADSSPDTLSDIQNQNQNQHERISELTDYSHLSVSRSCGGSHTITSASQRRSGLQYMKHHNQPEGDAVLQSEEVDIVGLDGHIYKGRLNAPSIRNTETKLPTIPSKDGVCKTKDKAKNSPSKPAVSPEAGHGAPVPHPHSAKSGQCSRSASSSSGRDWPVSTLGCTSQSSVTAEPPDNETHNL